MKKPPDGASWIPRNLSLVDLGIGFVAVFVLLVAAIWLLHWLFIA